MAAASELPEPGTEEFERLQRTLEGLVECGDVDALKSVGARVIRRVHPLELVDVALRERQVRVLAWLVEESERAGLDGGALGCAAGPRG